MILCGELMLLADAGFPCHFHAFLLLSTALTYTHIQSVHIFMECYANLLCVCACGEGHVGVCQQT